MIAAWADLLTGSRHFKNLCGTYATHFQGLRNRAPHGICAAIRQTLTACGWTEVPASPAGDPCPFQIGDVVLTATDLPGIWAGDRIIAAARGLAGETHLHPQHATSALHPPLSSASH